MLRNNDGNYSSYIIINKFICKISSNKTNVNNINIKVVLNQSSIISLSFISDKYKIYQSVNGFNAINGYGALFNINMFLKWTAFYNCRCNNPFVPKTSVCYHSTFL